MHELTEKCILFVANNLESILQVPCVLSSISEPLLSKLAACIPVTRLNDLVDKKDKIKSKLFQRKIEFMFNPNYLNSVIQNELKSSLPPDLYLNYLHEHENDASTLFRCKLCRHYMTKQQSRNLKCRLTLLDRHGCDVYLHVPDENSFDLNGFLRIVINQLKTWSSSYWFIWSLTKSYLCKTCHKWFRLVDANKCRLNEHSKCYIHDDGDDDTNDVSCSCMFAEHLIDPTSVWDQYYQYLFIRQESAFESPELRLNKFIQAQIDTFNRVRGLILTNPDVNQWYIILLQL